MKRHAIWIFTLLLILAAPLTRGAEITDIQDKLKGLASDLKEDADFDNQIASIRNQLIETNDPDERRALYTQWKNKMADRLGEQDKLNKRIIDALKAAQGLPSDAQINVQQFTEGFDRRIDSLEGSVAELQARSVLLKNKGELAAKFATMIDQTLKIQRASMQSMRERIKELYDDKQGVASTGELVTTLEAMLTISQARELQRQFEFAMAVQLSDMHDLMADVSTLFKNLLNGEDFQSFMKKSGMSDVTTATQMEELMDTFLDSTKSFEFKLPEEEVNKTVEEISTYTNLLPYRAAGSKFYYDAEMQRWYTRSNGKRVYMPADPENGSSKFIRVHDDGVIYSEVPGYKKPLRVMPLKDWIEGTLTPVPAGQD